MKEQTIKINKFIEKKCGNILRKDAVPLIANKFKIEYDEALEQYNKWREKFMLSN